MPPLETSVDQRRRPIALQAVKQYIQNLINNQATLQEWQHLRNLADTLHLDTAPEFTLADYFSNHKTHTEQLITAHQKFSHIVNHGYGPHLVCWGKPGQLLEVSLTENCTRALTRNTRSIINRTPLNSIHNRKTVCSAILKCMGLLPFSSYPNSTIHSSSQKIQTADLSPNPPYRTHLGCLLA